VSTVSENNPSLIGRGFNHGWGGNPPKLYRRGDTANFTKVTDGPKDHKGKLVHFEKVADTVVGEQAEPKKIKKRAKRAVRRPEKTRIPEKPVVKVNEEAV
jgi:hypothetical protein